MGCPVSGYSQAWLKSMANQQLGRKRTFYTLALASAGVTLIGGITVGLLLTVPSSSDLLAIVGAAIIIVEILVAFLIWQVGRTTDIRLSTAQAGQAAVEQALVEQQRLRRQLEQCATTQKELAAQLDALSMPVIPIKPGVVAMPLVGMPDIDRMSRTRHNLLQGIEQHRAQVAIIDLTGLNDMPAEAATQFARLVSAADLMGCRVILTGINTSLTRQFLKQKLDLHAYTRRDLQAGMAYAGELVK